MQDEAMLPHSVKMGINRLARSADSSQRRLMEQLAERQREPNHGETSVEDIEEFFRDRQEAVNFLKQLGEAECGQFFTGRRGRPTRIEWAACGALPIAKAFLQATAETPVSDGEDSAAELNFSNVTLHRQSSSELHSHPFLLRPDLTLSIALPLNLTKEEANRLADFIRAIPF